MTQPYSVQPDPTATAPMPKTAPAINPPRWRGRKTAVAAALAIGLSSVGAVAAAATVEQGGTGREGGFPGGGQGGPGGGQGFPGGQQPGGQTQQQQGGQGQQGTVPGGQPGRQSGGQQTPPTH